MMTQLNEFVEITRYEFLEMGSAHRKQKTQKEISKPRLAPTQKLKEIQQKPIITYKIEV